MQRPFSNQILTAKQVFGCCQKEVCGINVFFVCQGEIEDARSNLKARFHLTNTIPRTKGFHYFVPLSSSIIVAKWVLEDKEVAFEFDIISGSKNIRLAKLAISNLIICFYDGHYWVGLIDKVDKENDDVKVEFMHPYFPSALYFWPGREGQCYVPIVNVICKISSPSTMTRHQCKL